MAQTIANPEPAKVISRASECMRRLMEAGLSYDDLQVPIDDPEMRKRLVQYWRSGTPEIAGQNTCPVTANYDLTVEKAIKAGKYDWSNSDINSKNFPSDRKGTAEVAIELVQFGRYMESDEVLAELDKQGLRPATLPELLAFGAKYPDKQREFPIVALGSVWRYRGGYRDVAYLYSYAGDRYLNLSWLGSRWGASYRFAAVRK